MSQERQLLRGMQVLGSGGTCLGDDGPKTGLGRRKLNYARLLRVILGVTNWHALMSGVCRGPRVLPPRQLLTKPCHGRVC